jgi:putative DNA primase/helicase
MTTDTSYQKLLMKVGPPRAFKGVSDRVLEAVVGSENTTGFYLHALANTFGARWLVNKQVAFVEEVNFDSHDAKGRILGTLNSIVGEAGQSVERKGDNATPTIILPTRFSISCNELPNFHDTSGALAARLLILPFDKSFAGREDRGLLTKLLAELSGIANWGLEGLRRLRDNGRFSEPERGRQELNQFRRTTDAFGFLQDCLWVERGIDPGNLDGVRIVEGPLSITRPELIGAYTDWSIENGLTPDKSWIVRRMRVILPKLTESRGRRSGERERVYHGIGLATG